MLKRVSRGSIMIFAVLCGASLLLSSTAFSADQVVSAEYYNLATQGLNMSPVPLTYDSNKWDRVGYGSYLVNKNNCSNCHTGQMVGAEGYSDYNRYLGGVCYGSSYCSRNLTSYYDGMPGGYDFYGFRDLMHNGWDSGWNGWNSYGGCGFSGGCGGQWSDWNHYPYYGNYGGYGFDGNYGGYGFDGMQYNPNFWKFSDIYGYYYDNPYCQDVYGGLCGPMYNNGYYGGNYGYSGFDNHDWNGQYYQYNQYNQGNMMPWAVFESMSNDDLDAIYSYLQAIPKVGAASVASGVGGNKNNYSYDVPE